MILALGKFSTENFSKFSKAFSLVEVDVERYLTWDERDRMRFRAWIHKKGIGVIARMSLRIQRHSDEYSDIFCAIEDEFGAQLHLWLISSGRRRMDPTQDRFSRQEFERAAASHRLKFWWEWGEEDTPETLRGIFNEAGRVLDLDYHWKWVKEASNQVHFKLHGWHPERWMRRYGPTLIRKYQKRMQLYPESILILAHSGRIEEASEFE